MLRQIATPVATPFAQPVESAACDKAAKALCLGAYQVTRPSPLPHSRRFPPRLTPTRVCRVYYNSLTML